MRWFSQQASKQTVSLSSMMFHRISIWCLFSVFSLSFGFVFLSYSNWIESNEEKQKTGMKENCGVYVQAVSKQASKQTSWKGENSRRGNSIFRVKRFFLSTIFPVGHVGMWFINFYFYIGLLLVRELFTYFWLFGWLVGVAKRKLGFL